jgi:hypothetical protein
VAFLDGIPPGKGFSSYPFSILIRMNAAAVEQAVELLEKANVDLEPELLPARVARKLLAAYARAERLAAYGVAALAPKVDDAPELARVTGTSVGTAKSIVATGKVLGNSGELSDALQHGEISLDRRPRSLPPRRLLRASPQSWSRWRSERPFTC